MEKYILRFLPYREKNKIQDSNCRLCFASKNEKYFPSHNGKLLIAKNPAIQNTLLYIRNGCQIIPTLNNIIDVLNYISIHKNKICVCNMLNNPSISTHWHAHIIDTSKVHKHFLNYWEMKSKTIKENEITKINYNGIFYIYPYSALDIKQKTNVILNLYSQIQNIGSRILLAFTTNYILLCRLKDPDEIISISSHALYGYFFTGKKNKYEYMKKYGVENILRNNSTEINLFSR